MRARRRDGVAERVGGTAQTEREHGGDRRTREGTDDDRARRDEAGLAREREAAW